MISLLFENIFFEEFIDSNFLDSYSNGEYVPEYGATLGLKSITSLKLFEPTKEISFPYLYLSYESTLTKSPSSVEFIV